MARVAMAADISCTWTGTHSGRDAEEERTAGDELVRAGSTASAPAPLRTQHQAPLRNAPACDEASSGLTQSVDEHSHAGPRSAGKASIRGLRGSLGSVYRFNLNRVNVQLRVGVRRD